MRPLCSVIIPNYNGRPFLDDCIDAVLAQELAGGFEVLLVDNGSQDGSAAHVRARFPTVQVVEAGVNRGPAGAANLGLREAQGRYVALLNNDTRVRRGWLAALVAAAEADPRAAVVDSKVVFADRPRVINTAGLYLLADGRFEAYGAEEPDDGRHDRPREVFAATTTGALLRPEAVAEAGGFDETLFAYYEDVDLCWRLRLRGWKVLYEPRAVVEHRFSGTWGQWSPAVTFHQNRNYVLTMLKNARAGFALRSLARMRWIGGRHGVGLGMRAQVAGAVAAQLPAVLARRRANRRARTIPDAELERLLTPLPAPVAVVASVPTGPAADFGVAPLPPNDRFLWAVF
jgi:GT2 family glycosyltransferase